LEAVLRSHVQLQQPAVSAQDSAAPSPMQEPAPVQNAPAGQPPAAPLAPVGNAFQQADAQMNGAIDEQIAAKVEQGDIAAQQHAEQEQALIKRNEQLAQIQANADAQAKADANRRAALEQKYSAAVDEEASFKLNRGHYWESRSTGQKIAMAIGIGLSALGEALRGNGGKVPALDIMNAAIADDVNDQMAHHDNLQKRIGQVGTQQDRFRQMAADRTSEIALRMASASEAAARQVEVAAEHYASPQAKAAAREMAAGLRGTKAEWQTKAADGAWNRDVQQQQLAEQEKARKQASYQASQRLKEDQRQFNLSFGEKVREFDLETQTQANELAAKGEGQKAAQYIEQRKYEIPGTKSKGGGTVLARSEKEGQELRRSGAATKTMVGLTDDLITLINKEGGISAAFKSPEYQRIKSMSGALLAELKEANQLGALDNGVERLAREMSGDVEPTGWKSFTTSNPSAGLKQLRENQLGKFNNLLKAQDENAEVYTIEPMSVAAPTASETAVRGLQAGQSSTDGGLFGGGGIVGKLAASANPSDPGIPAESSAKLDQLAFSSRTDPSAKQALDKIARSGGPLADAAQRRLIGMLPEVGPGQPFSQVGVPQPGDPRAR
jgi:hypothetical protein